MAAGQALVREAMTHLKMRKGASVAQIRQQIQSNYSGKIDVQKRGVLTTALKGLLEKGQVEKKGPNYKLAEVSKLKNDEEEMGVPGRHHRRRRHHGGGGRRRHHKRRRHHRRRSRHRRRGRRHHRRRRGHHRRRRHSRRRRRR
ncbi:hypothetical protein M758_1G135700 [Ceratodon purpureus]|uniref:H15 domain-containing protein n=1 Tax=Ceratodon purpureus TaxID=3225 RepID=A0A8T0J5X1_CERPU|nr:hypothetical protein KC19_1G140800 [Ceratodon purpureus]KAG0629870.1 hypothetical protein M758_1G135700 [Ceratodon purpureus]